MVLFFPEPGNDAAELAGADDFLLGLKLNDFFFVDV